MWEMVAPLELRYESVDHFARNSDPSQSGRIQSGDEMGRTPLEPDTCLLPLEELAQGLYLDVEPWPFAGLALADF
jgi:hypothetical protein